MNERCEYCGTATEPPRHDMPPIEVVSQAWHTPKRCREYLRAALSASEDALDEQKRLWVLRAESLHRELREAKDALADTSQRLACAEVERDAYKHSCGA